MREELTSNIGTKLYASPEQTESNYYSFETDHFSAGLVLLELFQPLYTEMQRIQVLTKAREGLMPVDLEVKFKDLNDNLKELLNPNPWHRSDLKSIT
jgi:serine/threonine protein kinase